MVDGDVSALAPALRQRSRDLITAERCASTLPALAGIAAPVSCLVISRGQNIFEIFFSHVGRGMAACPLCLQHFFAL